MSDEPSTPPERAKTVHNNMNYNIAISNDNGMGSRGSQNAAGEGICSTRKAEPSALQPPTPLPPPEPPPAPPRRPRPGTAGNKLAHQQRDEGMTWRGSQIDPREDNCSFEKLEQIELQLTELPPSRDSPLAPPPPCPRPATACNLAQQQEEGLAQQQHDEGMAWCSS